MLGEAKGMDAEHVRTDMAVDTVRQDNDRPAFGPFAEEIALAPPQYPEAEVFAFRGANGAQAGAPREKRSTVQGKLKKALNATKRRPAGPVNGRAWLGPICHHVP